MGRERNERVVSESGRKRGRSKWRVRVERESGEREGGVRVESEE